MSSPQFTSYASILTWSYAMIVYGKVILITDAQKTRDYTLRFWLLRYRKLVLCIWISILIMCVWSKNMSHHIRFNTIRSMNWIHNLLKLQNNTHFLIKSPLFGQYSWIKHAKFELNAPQNLITKNWMHELYWSGYGICCIILQSKQFTLKLCSFWITSLFDEKKSYLFQIRLYTYLVTYAIAY